MRISARQVQDCADAESVEQFGERLLEPGRLIQAGPGARRRFGTAPEISPVSVAKGLGRRERLAASRLLREVIRVRDRRSAFTFGLGVRAWFWVPHDGQHR